MAAWVAVYLHSLASGGWVMDRIPGFMGYGFPGLDELNRHGAAVPILVRQGDWHRLYLDPFVNTTLIGTILTLWVWASLGGMLNQLAGAARSWIVFLLGGAAGSAAHAWQHPDLVFAGAGPTGCFMAAIGALGVWGLTNKGPAATAARKRAIGFLIAMVVLTALMALITGANFVQMGTFEIYAVAAGLLAGVLAMLAFGVKRVPDEPGVIVRFVAIIGVALLIHGLWVQVPRAMAGGGRMEQARDYASKIAAVERAAWTVKSAHEKSGRSRQSQLDATATQRENLTAALGNIRALMWLNAYEGRETLLAYLDTFEGFVRLDYGLYSIQLARMRQAWDAYHPFEQAFLLEAGIRYREESGWTSEYMK